MAPARTVIAAIVGAASLAALACGPSLAAPSPEQAARPAVADGQRVAEAPRLAPRPTSRAASRDAAPREAARAAQPAAQTRVRAPRPAPRPARLAAKARAERPAQQAAALQPGAGVRPRASGPRSVQAAATIPAAVSADAPLLVGVFGGADTRRALIRAPDGALRRVRQGDRFAGWTVSAIGPDSVQLRDGARAQTLRIPGS